MIIKIKLKKINYVCIQINEQINKGLDINSQ